ncbi:MAG: GFA family protein [Steroidobacteraceae bacterium]
MGEEIVHSHRKRWDRVNPLVLGSSPSGPTTSPHAEGHSVVASELNGGCLCGAVRYRTALPTSPPTLCHCVSCRRAAGSHVVGLYTVANETMTFTRGRASDYRSSPDVVRGFCGRCGTALTYWHAGWPDEISVTIASLDDPGLVHPIDHTWMAHAVEWDKPADGLPQFSADRPP